ncbi:hypothetical protein PHYPSEUDO_010306 [Phytophthora pseudosyringae]|uniref:Uncharacterized protein n=1 Tax=Phytophthora pseudosyringae TaxID=221518 RepID=A0A8T1VAF7_9STRA|nr:hypothetical protein PHYPSEUDO_010306 [Phytophthora pseudosyringae]
MFATPERRWSLRMVKWWAGWTQNESAETLVRYLLDQAATDEDKELADCLAPDREVHSGCPTTSTGRKRNAEVSPGQTLSDRSIEKRLKTGEASMKALEEKIDILVTILKSSRFNNMVPARDTSPCEEQVSILPPAKNWKDLCRMYWKADPSRHLFKRLSEWTSLDKKKSRALHSRLSVAKLIT